MCDFDNMYVHLREQLHIRYDRNSEPLRDEPRNHLILLRFIGNLRSGMDLLKQPVDDVP